MRLLVVDDSKVMRNKIERSVKAHSVDVVGHASNGRDAIIMFRQLKPDLVTLDITMPEMDGLETLDILLSDNPDAKILIISALADKATAIEALVRGALGFLCKPFDDMELNNALRELAED